MTNERTGLILRQNHPPAPPPSPTWRRNDLRARVQPVPRRYPGSYGAPAECVCSSRGKTPDPDEIGVCRNVGCKRLIISDEYAARLRERILDGILDGPEPASRSAAV